MDVLNDPYKVVLWPPGGYPDWLMYLEFENESRIVADLTTPIYDELQLKFLWRQANPSLRS